MEALLDTIREAGFSEVVPLVEDVTPEYAAKWGTGLDIQNYIQSGLLIGKKPDQV